MDGSAAGLSAGASGVSSAAITTEGTSRYATLENANVNARSIASHLFALLNPFINFSPFLTLGALYLPHTLMQARVYGSCLPVPALLRR